MAKTARQYALNILAESREITVSMLADIPEDKLLHQPFPGANHALWLMGHIAATDDNFAGLYDGGQGQLPEQYQKAFGMGSKPVADPAAYPPVAEVRQQLEATRRRLIAAVESATDAALAEPLPDDWKDFAPDKLAFLSSMAWHEGMHAGQLTVVRKSLGIAPKY
jgi:hypothetical protein